MKRIWLVVLVLLGGFFWFGVAGVTADCDEKHYICNDSSVFNGYWWKDGWVPFYPTLSSWFRPAPVWSIGNAVFYGRGPMEATAEWRKLSLKGYLGGVALMSPADIGEKVWLKPPDGIWEGPFLVVDTATRGDIFPLILFHGEVIEIDFPLAVKWGMVTESWKVNHWRLDGVQVSKMPPTLLNGCPIDYTVWWMELAEPADPEWVRTPTYRSPRTWKIDGKWTTFTSPTADTLLSEQQEYESYLQCEE